MRAQAAEWSQPIAERNDQVNWTEYRVVMCVMYVSKRCGVDFCGGFEK